MRFDDEHMESLIQVNGGVVMLDRNTAQCIADFERQLKTLKAKEDALKAAILAEMEEKNIVKLETPELDITYIAPQTRETFDTKGFRAVHPELYDDFAKLSSVSASIRLKVK
jgi:predicted secreted protein